MCDCKEYRRNVISHKSMAEVFWERPFTNMLLLCMILGFVVQLFKGSATH